MHKFLLLMLMASMGVVMAAPAETQGRGGIYFGRKSLNSNDWGDFDSQPAIGIQLDVRDTTWPLWATAGFVSSRDEEKVITSVSPLVIQDLTARTSEFHVGVKKDFFPVPIVRLSLSGGPAFVHASLDRSGPPFGTDSDSGAGLWGGADFEVYLGHVGLGVAYQYSYAKVDLLGKSRNAGGENLAFSVGFGW